MDSPLLPSPARNPCEMRDIGEGETREERGTPRAPLGGRCREMNSPPIPRAARRDALLSSPCFAPCSSIHRWIAIVHDHWRAEVARRRPLSARIDELEERVRRLQQENELLRARLRRVPLRQRPRYRGWERLLILHPPSPVRPLAPRHGPGVRGLRPDDRELASGRRAQGPPPRSRSSPPQRAPRPRRRPRPPTEARVAPLGDAPHRRDPRAPRDPGVAVDRPAHAAASLPPGPRPPRRSSPAGTLRSSPDIPGHTWILDFTTVGGLLRRVHVGAVVDACSRRVLALAAWPTEPTAAFAIRLLRAAVAVHGCCPEPS